MLDAWMDTQGHGGALETEVWSYSEQISQQWLELYWQLGGNRSLLRTQKMNPSIEMNVLLISLIQSRVEAEWLNNQMWEQGEFHSPYTHKCHIGLFCVLWQRLLGGTTVSCAWAKPRENSFPAQYIALVPLGKQYWLGIPWVPSPDLTAKQVQEEEETTTKIQSMGLLTTLYAI